MKLGSKLARSMILTIVSPPARALQWSGFADDAAGWRIGDPGRRGVSNAAYRAGREMVFHVFPQEINLPTSRAAVDRRPGCSAGWRH